VLAFGAFNMSLILLAIPEFLTGPYCNFESRLKLSFVNPVLTFPWFSPCGLENHGEPPFFDSNINDNIVLVISCDPRIPDGLYCAFET